MDDVRAWKAALDVTALALSDDTKAKKGQMQIVATATHYRVFSPSWLKWLHRLTKMDAIFFIRRVSQAGLAKKSVDHSWRMLLVCAIIAPRSDTASVHNNVRRPALVISKAGFFVRRPLRSVTIF